MDERTRRELLQQYTDGYGKVVEALADASDEELDRRPAPGKWTAREIVHHLADSEMTAAVRVRRLIAEDHAVIGAYDQDEFARRLHYDRPIASSLAAFKAARESTSELLERLSPAEWRRQGTHSAVGAFGVERWLEVYAVHAHNHAAQIRAAIGKSK